MYILYILSYSSNCTICSYILFTRCIMSLQIRLIQCPKCRSAYDNCCSLYCQSTLTTTSSTSTPATTNSIVKNRQLLPRKLIKSSTAAATSTSSASTATDISASILSTHTNSDASNTNNSGDNNNNSNASVESNVVDGSLPIPTKEEKYTGIIMIDQRAAAIEEYCKRYVV